MDTATGVRKISENVLQANRALIVTDKDVNNYIFADLPDGTMFVDTTTGEKKFKLAGQSDWVPDPAVQQMKQDNTICIMKDSAVINETFTVVSINTEGKQFIYTNTEGEQRTKPITDTGYFVFELEKGTYIPGRNHLTVMLDGMLLRSATTGDITELNEKRFEMHDKLVVGQTLNVSYIHWIRIGNPYPRIFMNPNEPLESEIGDLWIDTDGSVTDVPGLGNDEIGSLSVSWNQITGTPTTLSGYKITDPVSFVGHHHKVADIDDFPKTMQANGGNADTVQSHAPGTLANNLLLLDSNGKIPTSVIPDNALFTRGMIIDWYGQAANVPNGWAICDGTNNTPDLRGRFVLGVSDSHPLGQSTDSSNETVALTAPQMPQHTHDVHGHTSNTGAHCHGGGGLGENSGIGNPPFGFYDANNTHYGHKGDEDWDNAICNTSTEGDHVHTFDATTTVSGDGQAHNNMPPYYALYKIMKL